MISYQIQQYKLTAKEEHEFSMLVKKMGIQGEANTNITINGQALTLGKTGIYEIDFPDNYYYTITSVLADEDATLDVVVVENTDEEDAI